MSHYANPQGTNSVENKLDKSKIISIVIACTVK